MDAFVRRESTTQFTYPVGLVDRRPRPRRWFIEDVDVLLGRGDDTFAAACEAVSRWEQSDLGWFVVHRPESAALVAGGVVGYSARALGVWWSYCCRIVEVIDEVDVDGSRRFGFTYGTIGSHAERGEERFLVTLDAETGEVRGSILAISRPGRWFTVVGLPFARRAQLRFKPDALASLAKATARRSSVGKP